MPYLRLRDYEKQIQLMNLDQIVNNDPGLVDLMNILAQEEMSSYLVQKYNVRAEFTDTLDVSRTATYTGGSRVQLIAPAYVAATAYVPGNLVTQAAKVYMAIANTTGTFNPSAWTLLGDSGELQYVKFPYPKFEILNYYSVGSRVFWEGKVYTCLQATMPPNHWTELQAGTWDRVGYPNAIPGQTPAFQQGQPNQSYAQWGQGTDYQFTGWPPLASPAAWNSGTTYAANAFVTYTNSQWPDITTWFSVGSGNTGNAPGADIVNWLPVEWVVGDNRSQQMVMVMIDIALFHLHSRISPRNIPDLRVGRYKAAIKWLLDAAHGNVTPQNLPQNQPQVGGRIAWGGNTKSINSY